MLVTFHEIAIRHNTEFLKPGFSLVRGMVGETAL
jgi:hypothetical protein